MEGTILICTRNARTLFDSGCTHSFVALHFALELQQSPELLPFLLIVTTTVGKRVACESYYPKCSVQIGELLMPTYLIILLMHDFDVILGMDWLAKYRDCVDCFHKTINFKVQEPKMNVIFEGVQREKAETGIVPALDVVKLLENGCEGYFAFITEKKPPKVLENIPVACEFSDVFPDEVPGLPPFREVDFPIDLVPGTAPISKALY